MKRTPLFFIAGLAMLQLALASVGKAATVRDLDGDGIPNLVDTDVDNDGIPNSRDRNVDGGIATSGPFKGKYIGDHLKNDDQTELDIDSDGLLDNSNSELDIDGDGKKDDASTETDIDGDGKLDSSATETNTDGDGYTNRNDQDDDGDGIRDSNDDDDDGDGHDDYDDDDDDGSVPPTSVGPVGDGTAPQTLAGLTFRTQKSTNDDLHQLVFLTATAAKEIEGADIENFTYTYAVLTAESATVTIVKKPTRSRVYTFNFATGIFTRTEIETGKADEVKTGAFSLVQ